MSFRRPYRWLVVPLLVGACGGAGAESAQVAVAPARNGLACAGRSVEDSVAIPELGPLPSGEAVTSGIALSCTADTVRVLDWGPDSSASYVVGRADAMAIWNAFQVPGTLDERRLAVMLLIARTQE